MTSYGRARTRVEATSTLPHNVRCLRLENPDTDTSSSSSNVQVLLRFLEDNLQMRHVGGLFVAGPPRSEALGTVDSMRRPLNGHSNC